MPDTYCVDTSSFLKVYENYSVTTRQRVLNGLDALTQAARLRTVRVVLDEVKRHNELLGEWLQGRRGQLLLPDNDQLQVAAFGVVRQFPDLFDPRLNRLQADPFVVGAAQINYLVVVTEELPSHRRRQRSQNELHIPDVCAQLGIRCINLEDLLRIENVI
jgi:hypothetical protein